MLHLVLTLAVALARALLGSQLEFLAENLARRQQLAVFKHKRTRPRLGPGYRMFWVFLRSVWHNWANALVVVGPDTVVQWQRQGFKWFWRWISAAKRVGRPQIPREVQELIRRMARDNGWGAPRIHGGSKSTNGPSLAIELRNWLAFLHNHHDALV